MILPVIVVLTPSALATALRIRASIGGEVHGLAHRVSGCDVSFEDAGAHLRALFGAGRPIVAVMAAGAVIRLLAPALADKGSEPPVLAVAEDGSSVVPLLGGHHGANDLTRRLAQALDAHAAITTAGDLRFGVALDQPPEGVVLENSPDAKTAMAALLSGACVRLEVEPGCEAAATWLWESGLDICDGFDAARAVRANHGAFAPSSRGLSPGPSGLSTKPDLGPGDKPRDDEGEASGNLSRAGTERARGEPRAIEIRVTSRESLPGAKLDRLNTPTPDPSPQGGGERRAPSQMSMIVKSGEGGGQADIALAFPSPLRGGDGQANDDPSPSSRGLSPGPKSPSTKPDLGPGDKPRDDGAQDKCDIARPVLTYRPRQLALGIGCERGAEPAEVIKLAGRALAQAGLSPLAVGVVCSLDLKADEPAVHAVAAHFGAPARFFDASTLEAETPRLANPSDVVFAEVGCHGVAEGSALAAAGPDGVLVAPKIKSPRATAAIARAPAPFMRDALPGRARGHLAIVGIGPGSDEWRSPQVTRMVGEATDLVGYSLYLDLLGPLAVGKARHDFDLGAEEARVRHAMELAGQGTSVALVCSGDAGIYAMATLAFELLDRGPLSQAAQRIAIEVAPGISALQAAAARAGAPLGHDFCTISLSDLLTPWEDIQRRVKAAAEGDFVIAFYNPVSRKRRTQLAYARDELLKHRCAETPVILATNLGREGENVRIVPLGALDVDHVDMLTVVVVGSSQTKTVGTGDGRRWVYTPRGYAGKADAR